jgi:hypothetical protein
MRFVRTIVLATLASGVAASAFILAAIYLRFGIALGPHQQFEVIALIIGQAIIALGTAVVLTIVLALGGEKWAVDLTALVLAILLGLSLGALEIFGLVTMSSAAFSRGDAFVEDLPFLGAIVAPALLTILIQWWFVRQLLTTNTR